MLTRPGGRLSRERRVADPGPDRQAAIDELLRVMRIGDPVPLAFQINEIAGDRIYTRHGVTVGPGDVVIDAGANVGVAAAHFTLQCGAAEVHSFEPVPETFELLQRNLADIPACKTYRMGLSDTAGMADMTCFTGGDSVMSGLDVDVGTARNLIAVAARNLGMTRTESERMVENRLEPKTVECEFTTLSAFLHFAEIPRVDLLKIDVEGAELALLSGIEEPDWVGIRQIVAEVHTDEVLEQIKALLAEHYFDFTVEQSPEFVGTPIRMVYAVRPDEGQEPRLPDA